MFLLVERVLIRRVCGMVIDGDLEKMVSAGRIFLVIMVVDLLKLCESLTVDY